MNLLDHARLNRLSCRLRAWDLKTTLGPSAQPHPTESSNCLPFEEVPSAVYIQTGNTWGLTRLEPSGESFAMTLPPGSYRLAFTPNSPTGLQALVIDPDPGEGGQTD